MSFESPMFQASAYENPEERVALGPEGEEFSVKSIKVLDNRLTKIPSCIVINAKGQFGEKELLVSRYIGSDAELGYTEDWKKLDQLGIDLPKD